MSRRNLQYLFRPRSVALIGASDRPHSVGATVMQNLLHGGFAGPIWPINIRHTAVAGVRAYRTVADLPAAPDLAVLCTPARSLPGLIAELGALGTRAAVVIGAGLDTTVSGGQSLIDAMLKAARPYTLRILGPDCIGTLVPGIGLNASFAHVGARTGSLAFIAQSGALATAVLDWALSEEIGFSHFVSLGRAADVDFGDLLDYFGRESGTRAILIHCESLTAARKFMSAARTAARNKPVIVVRSGRTGESDEVAHSHSGALAGSDAVYEAAFRRAGMLRVDTTRELFDAVEILSHLKPYVGPRLAIVSNGGAPGVMAADALVRGGGELASIGAETLRRLEAFLPVSGFHANPVDIGGNARPERYVAALRAVLDDPGVDAVLAVHAPTAMASVADVAAATVPVLAGARCPAIACWMGGRARSAAEADSNERGVPVYATPEEAAGAFLYLARYHRSQALLLEAPASIAGAFEPDVRKARAILDQALAESRSVLTESEAKDVLAAYGIPVAAQTQTMTHRSGAHELLAGITIDATFGPVIVLGQGGATGEVDSDRAFALPPLNETLARDLISRTRVQRILAGCRDRPPVSALELTLIELSRLAADLPQLVELDIDPLLADGEGVLALDARIRIGPMRACGTDRFAIRPYPSELEERIELDGSAVLLRPIRPEDFAQHRRFLSRITPDDLRTRFFAAIGELPDRDLAYLTQIDYEREMAFIAVAAGAEGQEETLGVARASTDPENADAEFAVLVRSDWKGRGLGAVLLRKLIQYCRERGTQRMTGEVLSDNVRMLKLAASTGFRLEHGEAGLVELALDLRSADPGSAGAGRDSKSSCDGSRSPYEKSSDRIDTP